MSFFERDFEYDISYKMINSVGLELKEMGKVNLDLEVDINDCVLFKIEDIQEESIKRVKFKKVKTEGDIVGFLGFYLDLETGYLLMGSRKSKEYIPAFDLYRFINKFDNYVHPEYFSYLIERFKLGDLSIYELIKLYNKSNYVPDDSSLMSRVIEKKISSLGSMQIEVDNLIDVMVIVSELFNINNSDWRELKNKLGDLNIDSVNSLRNEEGLLEFYKSVRSMLDIVDIVNSTQVSMRHSTEIIIDEMLRGFSSMIHISHSVKSSRDIRDKDNIESIIYNLLDISEENNMEIALEYILKYKDKSVIYQVLQSMGVDKYIGKANMQRLMSKRKKLKMGIKEERYYKIGERDFVDDNIEMFLDFEKSVDSIERGLDRLESLY